MLAETRYQAASRKDGLELFVPVFVYESRSEVRCSEILVQKLISDVPAMRVRLAVAPEFAFCTVWQECTSCNLAKKISPETTLNISPFVVERVVGTIAILMVARHAMLAQGARAFCGSSTSSMRTSRWRCTDENVASTSCVDLSSDIIWLLLTVIRLYNREELDAILAGRVSACAN